MGEGLRYMLVVLLMTGIGGLALCMVSDAAKGMDTCMIKLSDDVYTALGNEEQEELTSKTTQEEASDETVDTDIDSNSTVIKQEINVSGENNTVVINNYYNSTTEEQTVEEEATE